MQTESLTGIQLAQEIKKTIETIAALKKSGAEKTEIDRHIAIYNQLLEQAKKDAINLPISTLKPIITLFRELKNTISATDHPYLDIYLKEFNEKLLRIITSAIPKGNILENLSKIPLIRELITTTLELRRLKKENSPEELVITATIAYRVLMEKAITEIPSLTDEEFKTIIGMLTLEFPEQFPGIRKTFEEVRADPKSQSALKGQELANKILNVSLYIRILKMQTAKKAIVAENVNRYIALTSTVEADVLNLSSQDLNKVKFYLKGYDLFGDTEALYHQAFQKRREITAGVVNLTVYIPPISPQYIATTEYTVTTQQPARPVQPGTSEASRAVEFKVQP